MACPEVCGAASLDDRRFREAVLQFLSEICLTQGSGSSENIDMELNILCDMQGDGSSIPFLRIVYYNNADQTTVVVDKELDATTDYTVTGTVDNCVDNSEQPQLWSEVLCDTSPSGDILGTGQFVLYNYSSTTGCDQYDLKYLNVSDEAVVYIDNEDISSTSNDKGIPSPVANRIIVFTSTGLQSDTDSGDTWYEYDLATKTISRSGNTSSLGSARLMSVFNCAGEIYGLISGSSTVGTRGDIWLFDIDSSSWTDTGLNFSGIPSDWSLDSSTPVMGDMSGNVYIYSYGGGTNNVLYKYAIATGGAGVTIGTTTLPANILNRKRVAWGPDNKSLGSGSGIFAVLDSNNSSTTVRLVDPADASVITSYTVAACGGVALAIGTNGADRAVGESFPFQRISCATCDGEVSTRDLDLDGNSYTVFGVVDRCVDRADSATLSPSIVSSTSTGVTTNGVQSVTIKNVGALAGTVSAVALPAGESVTFTGYTDLVTNQFYRINSISYDATDTTFLITETP